MLKKVHKPGKATPDPIHGLFEAEVNGKTCVVEYEPDTALRDSEQVPLLEEGGIEAFFRREVLRYTPDAWIDPGKTLVGYEISFTRHFYRPAPMRTLDEIKADIYALEQETELLKEQKQNVINQTVTRGLDPKVKLKPSGGEWIGDIPEHWEARRLRTLAAVRASGIDKNTNEDEVPVMLCNYVDVYKNDRITTAIDFMKATATLEEIRAFELRAGDVIITKDSESWDDIAIPTFVPEALPGIVLCAYHLALIRPFSGEIEGEFLFRAFCSDPVADQFRVAATGVTRFGLAQGAIKGAFFPLPPLEEQRAIIAHINEKCAEISKATSRAEREIELMREYRTRLISDVVTGQVDVRDIEVPEVAEDELLALEEDIGESDDAIDDEGDMDETD